MLVSFSFYCIEKNRGAKDIGAARYSLLEKNGYDVDGELTAMWHGAPVFFFLSQQALPSKALPGRIPRINKQ